MSYFGKVAFKFRHVGSIVITSVLLADCLHAQSPAEAQVCLGTLGYEQLAFDYAALWMDSYSFWIDDSLGFVDPVTADGAMFYDINGVRQKHPATVRVLSSQGDCLLQVATKTLNVETLQAFIDTDPMDDPDANYAELVDAMFGYSVSVVDYQRIVLINFTTELDTIRIKSRSALVLDGRVVFVD